MRTYNEPITTISTTCFKAYLNYEVQIISLARLNATLNVLVHMDEFTNKVASIKAN